MNTLLTLLDLLYEAALRGLRDPKFGPEALIILGFFILIILLGEIRRPVVRAVRTLTDVAALRAALNELASAAQGLQLTSRRLGVPTLAADPDMTDSLRRTASALSSVSDGMALRVLPPKEESVGKPAAAAPPHGRTS